MGSVQAKEKYLNGRRALPCIKNLFCLFSRKEFYHERVCRSVNTGWRSFVKWTIQLAKYSTIETRHLKLNTG